MKTKSSIFSSILLCTLFVVEAQAGTLDDIGFTDLKLELGTALPNGSSITVTQVEAQDDGATPSWIPDTGHDQFISKVFTDQTPGSNGVSNHATAVALRFYGSVSSSSTAIGFIDLFEVNDWLGSGFLNTGASGLLINSIDTSTTRIVNHSWAASAPNWDAEILRRTDFLIEQDEFIHVAGVSADTTAQVLLTNSFNAIVTGISAGTGTTGTATIVTNLVDDTTYVSGRTKPDIVAPESAGSFAASRVSSAAVLLMDYAHTNTLLSNGSTTNRNSDTIYNAERSETVKAILMAGADRETSGNTNAVDITDYRTAGKQTSNGLDTRFGAGQVNSYNSHHILAAGEQDSIEDDGSTFTNAGFDYDASFGGLNSSNATATYNFTTSAVGGQQLKAALVWNLDVLTTSTDNLYDLDLQLIDVTGGNVVVDSSTSIIDNTENLWFDLLSDRSYQLKVVKGVAQVDFDWDYALAWQIIGITVAETDGSTVTAEDGTTDTFTLVLDDAPGGDVIIDIVSSNINEATVSPASVTFNSGNWSESQTITVTGVNDVLDDGDVNYNINFTVSSAADANYNGLVLTSVVANNTDDEATFNFIDQTDVALNTLITSDAAVITGVDASLPISITGGEYSLNGGAYTSLDGFVNNNDNVTAQTTSSVAGLTAVDVVLNIGGSSDTFTVTTGADTDDDAVIDSIDNCPVTANSDQLDTDSDGEGNACDADDDNDGLSDLEEVTIGTNPLLADTDSDGTNDGVDAFPNDPAETTDTDGDTVGDNADNCPVNSNANQLDTDGDGVGNACDADDDNDGLSDLEEATIGTNPLLIDTDGDGMNDKADAFPMDVSETIDSDSDGVGDNADVFPNDATEMADTDSDGVGDNADAFPTNIAASVDADNDGLPDAWNPSCDVACQNDSGLVLDSTASSGGGSSGSLHLMWLTLPFFITACRRRVLH